MLKKLSDTLRKVNHTYLLIFIIFVILQRMDSLVCLPLLNISYAHQVSWWVLLSFLVIMVAILLYYSDNQTKQSLWHSILILELGVAGFLDVLYVFELPFPQMWLDLSYEWIWNPFYMIFGVWNIYYQSVWWGIWAMVIYLTWKYFNTKYHVYGLRK